jgi:hypothetical protein
MRYRPPALSTFVRVLCTCRFLVALLAALSVLAAPARANAQWVSNSGLAAPEDLVVEVAQDGVLITWRGEASQSVVKYTLYRSTSTLWQEAVVVDAPFSSAVSLESPDVAYSFYDQSAQAGVSYTYWVVSENGAESVRFGPYYSMQIYAVFLPLLARA